MAYSPSSMATLKANPKLSRQLTLDGPMLLWRDGAGGLREGLLLTTDVCENLRCAIRHLGLQALWVEEGLISVTLRRTAIEAKSRPGTNTVSRPAFFVSVGLDDGTVEPQEGSAADPTALAWLRDALDAELRAVLLARFEGARRLLRESAPVETARSAPREAQRNVDLTAPPADGASTGSPGRAAAGAWMAASPLAMTSRAPSPPAARTGRNDPCPCGSGRKYKKCCLGMSASG